jgi:hypothetical protein
MIEASQRMITINSQGEGQLGGGINPVIRKDYESCRLRLFKMHLEMQTS